MSRQEHEYVIGKGLRQLPIKWTAPEALRTGQHCLVIRPCCSGFVFQAGGLEGGAQAPQIVTRPPNLAGLASQIVARTKNLAVL